ncbi:MAG: DNA-processing protein DprA [Alphaproteobacteria bacterium]|nr:DNA-processing protein DprA [Alphaproteobacteria bacterium]
MTAPKRRPLARRERTAWTRLARTPGVGSLTFHRLVAQYKGADGALDALPHISKRRLVPPGAEAVEAEIEALEEMGARLIASCEPDYPALLAQIDPCPPLISIRGDAALFTKPLVAIVGAREASAAGQKLAAQFARELGELGFVIVSGMARGIDARVHEATLETGTIAVLAGGLDRPYPPQNLALHDAICARGAVIAEAPLGFQARARDFPRRNHIISGVSLGVVVIEAAERSGSLITARAAGEQGREVMAVPGSPLDPRSRGSNALLKQGAILVESAADVAEALKATPLSVRARPPAPLFDRDDDAPPGDALVEAIARLLSPTPVHVNDLARLVGAPAGVVAGAVTELELAGRAATLPGGYAASPGAAFDG